MSSNDDNSTSHAALDEVPNLAEAIRRRFAPLGGVEIGAEAEHAPLVQSRQVQGVGTRLVRLEFTTPPHPGAFIRSEIIDVCGLSIGKAAKALGVIRPTLSAMLNGRAALSPEMALRLDKAFGLSMHTLMRMQCDHDVHQMQLRENEIDVQPYELRTDLQTQERLL